MHCRHGSLRGDDTVRVVCPGSQCLAAACQLHVSSIPTGSTCGDHLYSCGEGMAKVTRRPHWWRDQITKNGWVVCGPFTLGDVPGASRLAPLWCRLADINTNSNPP